MIIPEEKIKVFISSACGDEDWKQKYNYVRAGLKALIEATQLATAYTFESAGGSIISATHHYERHLKTSDLCIFLIDNKDGIPDGVLKEIEIAQKHGIFSIYYFCDQFSKERPRLNDLFDGVYPSKYKVLHSFEDFIQQGAHDLINDLIVIFKGFCSNSLGWKRAEEISGDLYTDYQIFTDNLIPKSITNNLDSTKNYFFQLITEKTMEINKTNAVDSICSEFLPVLFEGKVLNPRLLSKLKDLIKEYQSEHQFVVTSKRLDAIQAQYLGETETCLVELEEALNIAKERSLPSWIINDILVDLRNLVAIIEESKSRYIPHEKYQKELMANEYILYYPLVDRFNSTLHKELVSDQFKYKIQSPYTVNFGNDLQGYIESLASLFVLALFNGSLTYLHLLYDEIMFLMFHFSQKYSDWNFKKLLLKVAIFNRNNKEIDGIINFFPDILGRINCKDAMEVYKFAGNNKVSHQKSRSQLSAFRIVGYFLDDEDFDLVWEEIYDLIEVWLDGDDVRAPVNLGYTIFEMLKGTHVRLDQEVLVGFLCRCLELNKRRFFPEVFEFIAGYVKLKELSKESADRLISLIVEETKGINNGDFSNDRLGYAIVALRKQDDEITRHLNIAVKEYMPDFYEGVYRLETSENAEDMFEFISKYVAEIENRNVTQGKDGRYTGYGFSPYLTIKHIIQYNKKIEFDQELINSAFQACYDTLLKENQTVEAKIEAINLMIFLAKLTPQTLIHNKEQVTNLLLNKETIETGKSTIITKLNERHLQFCSLLLYNTLGECVKAELTSALSQMDDEPVFQDIATQNLMVFLEENKETVDSKIEFLILHNAIKWCKSPELQVRCNSIQILFLLLENPEYTNIICDQFIKLMDEDNYYIKNLILRNAFELEKFDKRTYDYLIRKARLDTNFVVRKIVNDMVGHS